MEGMNRQYRREMKRQEKMRLQRAERAAARRRRVRERFQARREQARADLPPFRVRFRQWLVRPYKAEDMLLLFALLWLIRWAAFAAFGLGTAEAGAAGITWAVLLMQAGTGALALAYLRGLAREGIHWSGPPDALQPAVRVWGGGLAVAALAYGLGRGGEWLVTRIFGLPTVMAPAQMAAPVDWAGLIDAGGVAWAGVFAATFLLVAPVADELFYRRLLTRLFQRSGMADRWAVLFGAFLFGLGAVGIIPPSRAAVAGVVFGYAYVRTGSTGLVILGHVLTALLTALLG